MHWHWCRERTSTGICPGAWTDTDTHTRTWALLRRHTRMRTALSAMTAHFIWHQSMRFLQCRFRLCRTHQQYGEGEDESSFGFCLRATGDRIIKNKALRLLPRALPRCDRQRGHYHRCRRKHQRRVALAIPNMPGYTIFLDKLICQHKTWMPSSLSSHTCMLNGYIDIPILMFRYICA